MLSAVVPRVVVRCLLTAAGPLQRRRWCGFSSLRMASESLPALNTAKLPVVDPSRCRPLLLECLESAPTSAGCYIMEGADGRKLYIGKSVKLSSRVPSYFNPTDDGRVFPGGNLSRRIAVMTTLVERFVSQQSVPRAVGVDLQQQCRNERIVYGRMKLSTSRSVHALRVRGNVAFVSQRPTVYFFRLEKRSTFLREASACTKEQRLFGSFRHRETSNTRRGPHVHPWSLVLAFSCSGFLALNASALSFPAPCPPCVLRIEYIATVSGAEALLLEASLIKQHQPPFNVLLKDDKRNCERHKTQVFPHGPIIKS